MTNEDFELLPQRSSGEQGGGRGGFFKMIADVLEILILAVILYVAIDLVTARVRVDGTSMLPTLHPDELVIVNKLVYKYSQPKRGDIIVFHFPRAPEQEYIKRLIGLSGDRIQVLDGLVYVNGTLIDEAYIAASPLYTGDWVVPSDSYFVLGDNRNNSYDSHTWGVVPQDYVIGKALLVYWPLNRFRLAKSVPITSSAP